MLLAGLVLGALGFSAALCLSIASKVFYVYVDPRVELVEDALAGANCGGCGFPGCNSPAHAGFSRRGPPNGCMG